MVSPPTAVGDVDALRSAVKALVDQAPPEALSLTYRQLTSMYGLRDMTGEQARREREMPVPIGLLPTGDEMREGLAARDVNDPTYTWEEACAYAEGEHPRQS